MNSAEIRSRSDELLKLVGLQGRDRESVRRFSKGMYQRLGLAQALLHDPDLLVLDEPTDGLDPVGRNEVRKVIDRLRDSGKTIFLNSHILQEVEMVCTRVAILAKGEIKAIGPIDELAHRDQQKLIVEILGDTEPDWQTIFGDSMKAEIEATRVRDAFRFSIAVVDQDQINAVVDQLRRSDHSIARLEVRRESLEETFMRLVGTDAVEDVAGEDVTGEEVLS